MHFSIFIFKIFCYFFFQRLGYYLLSKHYTPIGSVALAKLQKKTDDDDDDNEPLENMIIKFSDSCWKFVYYFSSYILGIYASISEPFFYESELTFSIYPNPMT